MTEPGAKIGDYTLVQELGAGGMSRVFLAEKSSPVGFRKRFALKVLKRKEEERVASFIDEARIVAQLEHRNIAQVYDFGFDGETPYLVMELIQGITLQSLGRRYGRVPARAALEILRDSALALDAAHVARDFDSQRPLGIVHRDVCPTNIMISESLEVKLLDFGIAMAAERLTPNTLTGIIKGKPGYMSPEQLRGQELDPRTDIFSLWTVFAELVLGRSLYRRATLTETLEAHVSGELPRLSNVDTDFPAAIELGMERGLARDRNERFSTAAEVAEFAGELLEHTPGKGLGGLRDVVLSAGDDTDTFIFDTVETELTKRRPGPSRTVSMPWVLILSALGIAALAVTVLLLLRA